MLAVCSPSTKDLRSRAIDQKRYSESKHKWNPKWAQIAHPAPVVKLGPNNTQRPIRKSKTHCVMSYEHNLRGKALERTKTNKKQDPLGTTEDRNAQEKAPKRVRKERKHKTFDKSTELCQNPFQVLQVLDETGDENLLLGEDYPFTGNTVFGVALDRAVEKYEDRTLIMLVKEEYEVLNTIDEDFSPLRHAEESNLDDDFELI